MTTTSADDEAARRSARRSPALRHVPVRHDHAEHRGASSRGASSPCSSSRPAGRPNDRPSPTHRRPDHHTTCCRCSSPTPAGDRLRHPRRRGRRIASRAIAVDSDRRSRPADTSQYMFLGAMIMGPLAAWLMKWSTSIWEGKIKAGFEMLVNKFSAGILGLRPGDRRASSPSVPSVDGLMQRPARGAVDWLVDAEPAAAASASWSSPAKVLFLNNAINHGVFTPLGTQQAVEDGQVDPVPPRGEPRPRSRHPARVHVLRRRHGAGAARPARSSSSSSAASTRSTSRTC